MEKSGMNKKAAEEWLTKAWHNLSGAKLFYEANHYTDVTAVEIHYSVEKCLKSFLAYGNKKIPKTHDLSELHSLVQEFIHFNDNDLDVLDIISEYHIEESYPAFDRPLPPRKEIKQSLDLAFIIFHEVCAKLDIDTDEISK